MSEHHSSSEEIDIRDQSLVNSQHGSHQSIDIIDNEIQAEVPIPPKIVTVNDNDEEGDEEYEDEQVDNLPL